MDDTKKNVMQTLAVGFVKKALIWFGAIVAGKGAALGFTTVDYAAVATAIVATGVSFWNDYGKAIFLSQMEVIKAKSLAQAAKMRAAGLSQVTVTQIADQSDKLTPAGVTKTVQTLPVEVQRNIADGVIIKLLMVGLAVSFLAASFPASAQTTRRAAAAAAPKQTNGLPCDPANLLPGCQTSAATSAVSKTLSDVMSALAKPFQDLADFIAGDADGAASLATQIPAIQDTNGKACWVKMQAAGAVFKAHPVPLSFKLMTDFEALRLLQITTNDLCSFTPCTVVFSDASNLVTGVASAVGGAMASGLQIPSLTTLCSRIPQIAPQITPLPAILSQNSPAPTGTPTPPTESAPPPVETLAPTPTPSNNP